MQPLIANAGERRVSQWRLIVTCGPARRLVLVDADTTQRLPRLLSTRVERTQIAAPVSGTANPRRQANE
jgi:hypothetical protein